MQLALADHQSTLTAFCTSIWVQLLAAKKETLASLRGLAGWWELVFYNLLQYQCFHFSGFVPEKQISFWDLCINWRKKNENFVLQWDSRFCAFVPILYPTRLRCSMMFSSFPLSSWSPEAPSRIGTRRGFYVCLSECLKLNFWALQVEGCYLVAAADVGCLQMLVILRLNNVTHPESSS